MSAPSDALRPLLLDGPAIAAQLRIHPGTIRNWAAAGDVRRMGSDERGRTLYDYDEVAARHAARPAQSAAGQEHDRSITVARSTTRVSGAR